MVRRSNETLNMTNTNTGTDSPGNWGDDVSNSTSTTDHPSRPPAPTEEGVELYIKKSEVARRLQKTVRTVDSLMRRGVLPFYKIGRSVVFKWSDVESHLGQTCRVCRRAK